ncbi:MAG TPA: cell adhesion protein [Caproiciproducens sp.]|nr:cell adhesion protein [Caproiciproducens sp.]
MKKRPAAIVSFLTVICMVGTILAVCQPAWALNDSTAPRVAYRIVSNTPTTAISRGSSFEADFLFYDSNSSTGDNVKISVSSPNGSIANLPKGDLTPTGKPYYNNDSDSGYDANYYLNIPEASMRYVGMGPAVIKFRIYYTDTKKTYYVQKTIVECQPTASSSQGKSDLSLVTYSMDRTGIKEGQHFNLDLVIKNNGSVPNSHVTAVLDGLNPDEITVDGQLDTKTVDSVDAGGTATVSFPMICNPKMASKNYMLKVQLTSDESPAVVSSNVFVPVSGTKEAVESGSESNASKPIIIIESYDYGGKPVLGGKEFNLAMRFRNTNTAAQIENLKITVSSVAGTDDKSATGAFTPAKSSNTFYIAKVAPGGTFSEQIALIPKSDAAPNSYGISIAFSYEAVLDGKRQPVDATETIAIPLTQPDRFEVNEAGLPQQIFLGEPGQLSINYVNKGKSKIFNLSVKLTGNFTSGEMDSYIGNVDSGVGDTFQATLNPSAEGPLKGTAVFTYEDASGATKTLSKNFSCEVMPAQQEGEMNSSVSAPPGKGSSPGIPWFVWLIGAAAVVAVFIVLRVLLKKHKAKKLRRLEESDDYDDVPASGGKQP